jgi:hypothetical protein
MIRFSIPPRTCQPLSGLSRAEGLTTLIREPRDRLLQSFLKLHERPPIEQLHCPADIGATPLRVIDHGREVADTRVRANDLGHQARDLGDRQLYGVAKVDRSGLRRASQAQQAGDSVADIEIDRVWRPVPVTVHG